MPALLAYPLAALAEIAGCFTIWNWWRLGATAFWILPGACALLVFGWLLAQVDTTVAGRAFAAYGGVYIAASVMWMWLAEGQRPDRWDVIGVVVCLIGAAIILLGPRNALS
ncbi:small multidrug resistance family-3 protein [Litoreibacter meonggei]|uniref:Small multidrug resistance family-3 protein n=1 Tax=Litoreibacter meonggei TaxID=1049199 RepID=A0A497VUQ9_9RHOB|nr:YnfA family protein [Litoreibacter meonggei]RLJ40593.1 small multidrug resistance family-3 protein [Litoreibacter meonggei]